MVKEDKTIKSILVILMFFKSKNYNLDSGDIIVLNKLIKELQELKS